MTYQAQSAYSRKMGAPHKGDYRRTPEGQPSVADLIKPGMTIRTGGDTTGIVLRVTGPYPVKSEGFCYYPEGLETYSITILAPEKYGRHRNSDLGWINECVAVDGRILKLFEANTDEIFIVDAGPRYSESRSGQLSLF